MSSPSPDSPLDRNSASMVFTSPSQTLMCAETHAEDNVHVVVRFRPSTQSEEARTSDLAHKASNIHIDENSIQITQVGHPLFRAAAVALHCIAVYSCFACIPDGRSPAKLLSRSSVWGRRDTGLLHLISTYTHR